MLFAHQVKKDETGMRERGVMYRETTRRTETIQRCSLERQDEINGGLL